MPGREMSDESTIRTASQNDLPSLLELYKQLHPNDETMSPTVASNILAQFLRYPVEGHNTLAAADGTAARRDFHPMRNPQVPILPPSEPLLRPRLRHASFVRTNMWRCW